MIVIIDYKMGNVGSILNMLKKIGHKALITSDHAEIRKASKIILPGVGAFDSGMDNLAALNLIGVLNEKVIEQKTPALGVCLGMQLITRKSEEGVRPGLGWVEADTVKFDFSASPSPQKIPHMGWNICRPARKNRLFEGLAEPRFYFVHSYYVECANADDVLGVTDYGGEFCSALQHENVFGTQFHPEKSHKFGMKLFENFVSL